MSFSNLRTSPPSRQKSRLGGQIYAHPQRDSSSIRTTTSPSNDPKSLILATAVCLGNVNKMPRCLQLYTKNRPHPTDFIPSSIVFSIVLMEKEQDESRNAAVLSKNRFAWPVAATTTAPTASARLQVGWQLGARHGVRDEPERMHRRQFWVQAFFQDEAIRTTNSTRGAPTKR